MDTVARLAAEEAALAERFTRVTRGQLSSLDDGGANASAGSNHKQSSLPVGESREERLKKREDEKRAREEAEEQKMLEQVREREREEARARNGGVLPYEMMNEQEKANYDFEQEKETKRLQKEAEKKKREDVKVCHPPGLCGFNVHTYSLVCIGSSQRQRAKERRAELKAEKEAAEAELAEFEAEINPPEPAYAAPVQQYHQQAPPLAAPLNEEPPWYTDCEVCGRQGWNIVSEISRLPQHRSLARLLLLTRCCIIFVRTTVSRRFAASNAKNGNTCLVTSNATPSKVDNPSTTLTTRTSSTVSAVNSNRAVDLDRYPPHTSSLRLRPRSSFPLLLPLRLSLLDKNGRPNRKRSLHQRNRNRQR